MPEDKPSGGAPGDKPLIQYPTIYAFKVMGLQEGDFPAHVRQLFARLLATDLSPDSVQELPSSRGKYVSVTVSVVLHSEAQRLAVYAALHQDKRVVYYL